MWKRTLLDFDVTNNYINFHLFFITFNPDRVTGSAGAHPRIPCSKNRLILPYKCIMVLIACFKHKVCPMLFHVPLTQIHRHKHKFILKKVTLPPYFRSTLNVTGVKACFWGLYGRLHCCIHIRDFKYKRLCFF